MTTKTKTTWRKVKLGEVGRVVTGKTPPTAEKEYFDGDFPFITPTDITDFNIRYNYSTERFLSKKWFSRAKNLLIPKNSICFVCIGSTIGKICLVKEDSFTNQQINTVVVDPLKADFRYIYYLLRNNQGNIIKEYGGSGVAKPIINKSTFENIEFLIPHDVKEQKRIAEALSVFDDKVELNNKINQNLEAMAQAIFKEWLSKNQKSKIKNQKIWKVSKIGDLVEIISGYPFSSRLYNKKGLGVVTIKNVQDGNFITTCDSFISEETIPKNINPECRIRDEDILLSLTGNVGRVCFVYGGEYLLNQRVAKLKPKNERNRAFCYFLFRQGAMQNQLINMAKGSAQPNLSPVETGEIMFTIPPRETLDRFNEIVGPIYKRLIQIKKENQKLASLRDLLLPKLMSGEARV
jgi:type I restriction enzyme S subunit